MNEKLLYLECYSGISGDMTVAALLDLGADQEVLLEGLKSLKVSGYKIEIGRVLKNSIDACDFNVILEQKEADYHYSHENNPGQDEEHANGHIHEHSHEHEHDHHHDHNHDHTHSHMQLNNQPQLVLGHHEHRNLSEINAIIEQSDITDRAKAIAKKIFHIIAVAEAKAHSKPIDEVHFHEVGAVDSIVDIVSAAICIDNLGINNVIISELYEGTGQIRCQHGLIPVPVPAVSNISAEFKLPLHITGVKGEMVTPTGAAIVAALKTMDTLPKDMRILKIGLGAGKRKYEGATGLLRAMLIEDAAASDSSRTTDTLWRLEAKVGTGSEDTFRQTMDLLSEKGAKDVYYSPVYMKNGHPTYLLQVICRAEDVKAMEDILFASSSVNELRKQEVIQTRVYK